MNNDIDYYKAIKQELEDNEIYKKVKDYSKNKYELKKYCNVGKLLIEAGNKYGEKNIVLDIYLISENYIYSQKCTHWVHYCQCHIIEYYLDLKIWKN